MSLRQVQRQTNKDYKAAVELLRKSPAEGYDKLAAMGSIREVDWRLRGQETARAYREAGSVPNVKGKERSVLVVAATHNEIKSVTFAIRSDKTRLGELGEETGFVKHTALNWTEAQKREMKNYQPGQVLAFHKRVKGVAKGEALTVVTVAKGKVTAERVDGARVEVTVKQVKAFGVFEPDEIKVAMGDKLLLQANWRDKNFRATNGELVTVRAVSGGAIKLTDGRELPAEYRQFTHGYAVTAHRSQGKTVDYEVIAAERMAQDLFYVSATRAREGITVVTSDSLTLQESIGVSGDRQSASELARRTGEAPKARILFDDLKRLYLAQRGPKPITQSEPEKELPAYARTHITNTPAERNTGIGLNL